MAKHSLASERVQAILEPYGMVVILFGIFFGTMAILSPVDEFARASAKWEILLGACLAVFHGCAMCTMATILEKDGKDPIEEPGPPLREPAFRGEAKGEWLSLDSNETPEEPDTETLSGTSPMVGSFQSDPPMIPASGYPRPFYDSLKHKALELPPGVKRVYQHPFSSDTVIQFEDGYEVVVSRAALMQAKEPQHYLEEVWREWKERKETDSLRAAMEKKVDALREAVEGVRGSVDFPPPMMSTGPVMNPQLIRNPQAYADVDYLEY